MSCNCNGSGCAGCCGTSTLSPCTVCAPNTAANETLSSVLDNFIASFFGELTKTEVNGVVIWVLPCDLNVGLQNNPRLTDEGLACYFLRLFEDGITGLTGPRGFKGDAGTDGASGVCFLTSAFTQPTDLCPDITITVDNPDLLAPEMYIWIPGSGYYQVVQVVGDVVTITLIAAILSPNPTTPIDTPVIPAGARGETGIQGLVGPDGPQGLQGNPGNNGSNGANGTSVQAYLETTFTIPAVNAESAAPIEIDVSLGSFGLIGATQGQWVWVEGAGYFQVTTWTSATQFKLTNPLGYFTNETPGTVVGIGAMILAMPPPSPSELDTQTVKSTVRACSAGDGNRGLNGADTIDGVVMANGDRVLITAQTDSTKNGIYVVNTAGVWTRATDCNSVATMFPGIMVPVGYNLTATRFNNTVWTLMWDMASQFDVGTDDAFFYMTNAFLPAYASVGYQGHIGGNPVQTWQANDTWKTIYNNALGTYFDAGRVLNITPVLQSTHPVPKVEIVLAGDYLCSFSAEAYRVTANADRVELGILLNGAVDAGGGVCGGQLDTDYDISLTLSGQVILQNLQTGDEVELMSRNRSGNRVFNLRNVTFTIHRVF